MSATGSWRKPSDGEGGETLQRRLERARLATQGEPGQAGLEAREILETRARQLALEPEAEAGSGERIEVVEFTLADERYALDTRHVREVYPLEDLTPLPGTPEFVLGLVNLRGEILSVLDLKRFFGLPQTGLTDLHRVLFLRDSSMEFGILADAINGIRSVDRAGLQPSLPTVTGIEAKYLAGITRDRVVILDGERLLTDPDIVVRQQPGPGARPETTTP